jgi:hypothetical protein
MFALILAALATPEELYNGAIARLATLHQTPYLSYEMDQTGYTRENGILFDQGERIIERRPDRGFHNQVMYGAPGVLAIGRHYLTPDEFIPNTSAVTLPEGVVPMLDTPAPTATSAPTASVAAQASLAPTNLKTIASVSATASYALTYVADETINNNFCGTAAHITLKPKRDSDVFNVRELWIRRSDFALCAAIFSSWSFSGLGHQPSLDAVWLDERGFITNWRAQFSGNLDAGQFKDVTWLDSVPNGMYFSH